MHKLYKLVVAIYAWKYKKTRQRYIAKYRVQKLLFKLLWPISLVITVIKVLEITIILKFE